MTRKDRKIDSIKWYVKVEKFSWFELEDYEDK